MREVTDAMLDAAAKALYRASEGGAERSWEDAPSIVQAVCRADAYLALSAAFQIAGNP